MNANELADELENKDRLWAVDENLMIKTCAVLRQQQAEIEALKAKTLTDEEILEIWNQHSKYGAVISVYDFAKAILRKAQKK